MGMHPLKMKYVQAASLILTLGGVAAQEADRRNSPGVPIVVRYDAESIYLSNGLVDALFTPKFCRRVFETAFDGEGGPGELRLRMRAIDGQDRQPPGCSLVASRSLGRPTSSNRRRCTRPRSENSRPH